MLFKMDGKKMKELLIELFSEEIPSKMQVNAAHQMLDMLTDAIKKIGLEYNYSECFVTPRRIALYIDGIPAQLSEKMIEKKGPKVGARKEAIDGFLKSVEMSLDELSIIDNFYYAKKLSSAKSTEAMLKEVIEQIFISFTWPKSMRSSQSSVKWIRPLRNILCLFGEKILPIKFAHLVANNKTYGHRFMSPNILEILSFSDYKEKMAKNYVILSSEKRKDIIIKQVSLIADKLNLIPVLEKNLLDEVKGLVEYPHVLLGKIGEEFVNLPKEILITAMKVHQRYFYLEDKNGKIAPYFLTVSNVDYENNELIILGNEKVLQARLSDAKFFWEKDLKQTSSEAFAKLAKMTFHSKLGTMFDKVTRIISIAEFIADGIADIELVKKSALLCKTDLVSEVVGEFPELQGIMGKYYAKNFGMEESVSIAIAEHYRPVDTSDIGNISIIGAIISIADKLDTILGLWLAGEKPTSSKDPFALRRSVLGIIKLIRFHQFRFSISSLIDVAAKNYDLEFNSDLKQGIIDFFDDRLKYFLKNEGFRHDLIMASISNNGDYIHKSISNLLILEEFIKDSKAEKLVFAIKRMLNILSNSDAKLEIDNNLFTKVEKDLYSKFLETDPTLEGLVALVDFINKFFDEVMVNDSDPKIKQNRLNLLQNIVTFSNKIADFSLIEI